MTHQLIIDIRVDKINRIRTVLRHLTLTWVYGTDRFRHLYMKNKHLIACTVSKLDPKRFRNLTLNGRLAKQ